MENESMALRWNGRNKKEERFFTPLICGFETES
jgi:hypothetical protein